MKGGYSITYMTSTCSTISWPNVPEKLFRLQRTTLHMFLHFYTLLSGSQCCDLLKNLTFIPTILLKMNGFVGFLCVTYICCSQIGGYFSSLLLTITPDYKFTNLVVVYMHTLVNYNFFIHYSLTFASEIDILYFC